MSPRATAWGAYTAIAEALRAKIAGGDWKPGSLLPSESALSAEYGVARNTVRRALDVLAEEGLVEALPGRGRVVADPGGKADAVPRYQKIAMDLRRRMESGELRPGDALPSESELSDMYGVARGTARHALAELEGAGLVESVHGKGRYVRNK
ncbi:GntR family transcriptional regulator [Allorhizocola rhizosphaerae]|uniref:GntR family transcriptional regulator n=1 Tax=Allorhizocola rhizosphaerae TaxID=1872709 RepID=UPI000E3DFAE3|nr:GntR family transcriptional regulator [Allorhizocola rhizosphaerae]